MDNRPNGGGNRPEPRSRGNAPQLHEKYKAMARDAQLAGDRVQTEYYLQFADHYFRILNETRARFDEQRPRHGDSGRDDAQSSDAGDDYEEEDSESGDESQANGRYDEAPRQQSRPRDGGYDRQPNVRPAGDDPIQRDDRTQRDDRPQREDRPQRDSRPEREAQGGRPQRASQTRSFEAVVDAGSEEPSRQGASGERETGLPRGRPPRAPRAERDENAGPGIDFDRLPPAIARPEVGADGPPANGFGDSDGDAPRPIRRPRRPRESTPAAA